MGQTESKANLQNLTWEFEAGAQGLVQADNEQILRLIVAELQTLGIVEPRTGLFPG
jgi:hypothetical protein